MDKKFKIFVIVAIAVLGISIAASTFFVLKSMGDNDKQTIEREQDVENKLEITEVSMGDAIMTNISIGEDKIQHFAKIKLSLGVDASDAKVFEEFQNKIATQSAGIRDEIISVIGEQTFAMIGVNVNEGKIKLGDEIVARLNKLLDTDIIYDVRFEEYFVQ